MTELLYQTGSYLREVEAVVVAIDGQVVALDRTVFFPGGGGQTADKGVINANGVQMEIAGLKRKGDTVWHSLKVTPPAEGTPVIARLDWEHRYQMMRTHTALHILCGVIFRDYGALVTGGNMKPLQGRMDFELEHMTADFADEVEARMNEEVAAARPVTVCTLPREEAFQIPDQIRTRINLLPEGIREVRVVDIVGLDMQADGGTHVANTEEVGHIQITGHESKGKINKRLRIALGA
jgi:misacylated tRNA(Ala) deacylase